MSILSSLGLKRTRIAETPCLQTRSYDPLAIERNFPKGMIVKTESKDIRYHLSGRKLSYEKLQYKEEENQEDSQRPKKLLEANYLAERSWYSLDKKHLQIGTVIEAVGALETDTAEMIDQLLVESWTEDSTRIRAHKIEAKRILLREAINPFEVPLTREGIPEMPLIFLYEDHYTRTRINGSIGLYLSNWRIINPEP